MICKLAPVGCNCEGADEAGNCTIYLDEGVTQNMKQGYCVYRNVRASNNGIYTKKRTKRVRAGQQKQQK